MNEADWWTEEHTSRWDRLKATLKRDWEHAKAALTGKAKGSEVSEMDSDEVSIEEFTRAEPALRYGVGTSSKYPSHTEWDEALESKLSGEWNRLEPTHSWDDAKEHVRRGWDAGRQDLKGKSGKIDWALCLLGMALPLLAMIYLTRGY
jgi:hypothetical protein